MKADGYDYGDMDPFFRDLGELQAKLLSLEYWLRTFLFRHARLPFMPGLDSIAVGDVIEENPFTNYDQLSALIDKYNEAVRPQHEALVIDPRVIEIRHALAHGRIHRKSKESQPLLLKFSKPEKGRVYAETVVTLDPVKLRSWRIYLFKMERTVLDAFRIL